MSAKRWKLSAVAVFSVIFVAGAGFAFTRSAAQVGGKGATPDSGFDVLRLPNSIAGDAHLADEKGFFAKYHIRVDWTGNLGHGPAGVVSVVAGQNDAAGSISTAMITARSSGAKVKIVAASSGSTKEAPLFRYIVKDGSPITGKPTDFIGKKVVANPATITWYPLVVYLKRAGVDYHKVQFVSLPSPLATEQALNQGEVDVLAASDSGPPGSKLLKEGGYRVLPGISDFEVLGIDHIGGWVMREDFIQAHPHVVRRFIAALAEADVWGNEHPTEAREIISRRMEVPAAYRKYQGVWRKAPPSALVDEASIRKWIAILEEFEQIPRGVVKPEDVFTNAYNPSVSSATGEATAVR